MDSYHSYYSHQAQGGGGGVGGRAVPLPVYSGIGIQTGRGLGNILGAAFRMLSPAIKSVGKAVLRQGVATGSHILSDVIEGKSLKQAAKRRASEGGQALVNQALARSGLVPGPPPAKKRKSVKKRRGGGQRRQLGRGRARVHRLVRGVKATRKINKKKGIKRRRGKRRGGKRSIPKDIFG